MRKIFISSFLILISLFVKAQGNLQFNRVITYSGTLNGGTSSDIWTVPTGKVWKIESLPNPGVLVTTGSNALMALNINGVASITFNNSNYPTQINLPIWLKENDNIKFSHAAGSIGYYFNYYISIIEFNLTQ
jgi:hypothetical protein